MGQTNYCAAKSRDYWICKALALESASKDITVNVIAPGYVETEMIAIYCSAYIRKDYCSNTKGRLAQAERNCSCSQFLVKDESSYITGETLNINGGLYLS